MPISISISGSYKNKLVGPNFLCQKLRLVLRSGITTRQFESKMKGKQKNPQSIARHGHNTGGIGVYFVSNAGEAT